MTSQMLHNNVIAEETHAGRIWALIILPALLGLAVSVAVFPTGPARFALILVAVLGGGALLFVLSGFQYRFLRNEIEIRTIGFVLRTVPKQAIMSYSIEPWSMARGYGIRAMGNVRAYVWGNKVVHIKTTNGEIYLGHREPERIVRYLDQMTGLITPTAALMQPR